MRKNNKLNGYAYLFGIMIIMALVPGTLGAALPQPLNLLDRMSELLPVFVFAFFWPAAAVVFTSIIKIWLMKRKLSLPWKLHHIEKLTLASLAETIVEFVFLVLTWWFFNPAVTDLLKNMDLTTLKAKGVHAILHTALATPFYCILGTLTMLALLNFLASLDREQLRRKYVAFSILLSLLLPVTIILTIAVRILFFK